MLKTFSLTDIGLKRTMNQDFVFTSELPVGNLPNLFIVADGMGGYNGGGYASRYTVEVVLNYIEQSAETDVRDLFVGALKKANTEVRKKAGESDDLAGMGTTAVLACVKNDYLYVANVGDSRLYIINDDIRQITVDHSFVEEMIRIGNLDRESARNHPKKNIITRAVGADENIVPDFYSLQLVENDEILICSDGLTNMVEDEEIRRIVKTQRDIAGQAEALINAANNNGGRDNIGVVLVEPFASK